MLAAYEATKTQHEPNAHVEKQIYEGFAINADDDLMAKFHTMPWQNRHELVDLFQHAKFSFLAKRLIFVHDPNCLPVETRQEMFAHVNSRIAAPDNIVVEWTTLTKALRECEKLLLGATSEDREILEGYRSYLVKRISDCLPLT